MFKGFLWTGIVTFTFIFKMLSMTTNQVCILILQKSCINLTYLHAKQTLVAQPKPLFPSFDLWPRAVKNCAY